MRLERQLDCLCGVPTRGPIGIGIFHAEFHAENEPESADILDRVEADALSLRPDGYAFGRAADASGMPPLVERLADVPRQSRAVESAG